MRAPRLSVGWNTDDLSSGASLHIRPAPEPPAGLSGIRPRPIRRPLVRRSRFRGRTPPLSRRAYSRRSPRRSPTCRQNLFEGCHELERGFDRRRNPLCFEERDSGGAWLDRIAGNRNDGPHRPERKRTTSAIVNDWMDRSRSLQRDLGDDSAGAVRFEIGSRLSRLNLRASMLDRPEQDAHADHADNIQGSPQCCRQSVRRSSEPLGWRDVHRLDRATVHRRALRSVECERRPRPQGTR